MLRIRKTFKETGKRGTSIFGGSTAVVILMNSSAGTWNPPRMTFFNPFVAEENKIGIVPSLRSLPVKGRPTLPKVALSAGTKCIMHLRARTTITKEKKLMKVVRKTL